jgi:hypothetical protein
VNFVSCILGITQPKQWNISVSFLENRLLERSPTPFILGYGVMFMFSLRFSLQAELSQILQTLSEKARTGTEFIQRLKSMQDRVQVSDLKGRP